LVGATAALTATTNDGQDSAYTWTSSDETVATVDAMGVVRGLAVGETTVTATGDDTGMSDALIVTVVQASPNYDKWLASAHADATAEAFTNWNADDPAVIPPFCAKCHSPSGFIDFIGEDGTLAGHVDLSAPVGSVIHCGACHNETAEALDSVTFPSGAVVDRLGAEARCMTCHQGRASTDSVNIAIADALAAGPDVVNDTLSFQNVHYYAAGATLNAGRVRGGYQYDGKVYDWRFRHVPGYDSCIGCHDPHSLEVKLDDCKSCHTGVDTLDDLKSIRMMASLGQDYDGDGDLGEGIHGELVGLRGLLLAAIETYTVEQGLGDICYTTDEHPFWYVDSNGDGDCDDTEAASDNHFESWTPRLVQAAYNYQVATKDLGAFAHNAKYAIQLLYDSVEDLNVVLTAPIGLANAVRNDVGHFNGAGEAARHWDEDEEVKQSCSKCHGGGEGFNFYLEYGVGTTVVEPDNGLDCNTCHDSFDTTFSTVAVDEVTYPSDVTIDDPGNVSNICATCHSGRKSKQDVDDTIASGSMRFQNVHYLPAAAVKKGALAGVGYEYDGKTYAGEWVFHGQCVNCHDAKATNHSFRPSDNDACTNGCHAPTPVLQIRTQHTLDYDGDNDASEPLSAEIAGLAAHLLTAMQGVATANGQPICYDPDQRFCNDTTPDGVCDASEAVRSNRYSAWTPALLKAGFNYQLSQKERGAWAHNFDYMAQLLIDGVEDLGTPPASLGLVRP
jgi:hypothetical protein